MWASFNRGVDSDGYAGIVRWDGKAWKVSKRLPKYSSYFANEILPFGSGKAAAFFGNRLWLFDGRTWSESRAARPVSSPSGVSAKDIWALGDGGRPYRFDGRRWRGVTVPAAALKIDPAPCLKERPNKSYRCADTLVPGQVLVQSPNRVLLVAGTRDWPVDRWRVLRWNGERWSALTGAHKGGWNDMRPDGDGGLWAARYLDQRARLLHVTKKGRAVEYLHPAPEASFDHVSVSPSGAVFTAGHIQDADGSVREFVWRLDR